MRELRLSIPLIGGVTAIYTEAEVNAAKQRMHAAVKNGAKHAIKAAVFCAVFTTEMVDWGKQCVREYRSGVPQGEPVKSN